MRYAMEIDILEVYKSKNAVFVSAALHGENESKSEIWDLLLFLAIFAKGFKQNSMN